MSNNVRPATMERITTPELAQQVINEQVSELQAQIEQNNAEIEANQEKLDELKATLEQMRVNELLDIYKTAYERMG